MPEDLARNIHNYFKNSSKRQAQFAEFQIFCNLDVHKILRPSQTRWLSLLAVVRRILEQWDALKIFFISEQYAAAKGGPVIDKTGVLDQIVQAMSDPQVKIYYYFLDWMLPKFVELNELFQSENSLITTVYEKMSSTYSDLLSIYMDQEYVKKADLVCIDPSASNDNPALFKPTKDLYLGVKVLQELSKKNVRNKGLEQEVRTRCFNFVSTACRQLKARFDFSANSTFALMAAFHPSNAYSTTKTRTASLVSLVSVVPRIVVPEDTGLLQKIDDQWRKLPLAKFEDVNVKEDQPDTFWLKIKNAENFQGQKEFMELATFALQVLSLPHSSACVERVFSKVNLTKTDSRNKLHTFTLNGLLLSSQCAASGGGCFSFPPSTGMISGMNSETLYPQRDPQAPESRPKPAAKPRPAQEESEDDNGEPDVVFADAGF